MTDTTKHIPHSECIQGRCMNVTTGCWGECSIRAAFPLDNVACGNAVQPRVSEQADIESIASNADAMIILTQSYPREAVVRVVDAHAAKQVAAALAQQAAPFEQEDEQIYPAGYSPSIVDADGLPKAMRTVIETKGSYDSLEALYAFIDTWGEAQRKYAITQQAAPEAPTCPLGCTGPEQGGSGCMAVVGDCAMDLHVVAPEAPATDRQNMTHAEMLALCEANPAAASGLPLKYPAATTASASVDTPELRRLVNEYRQACEMVKGHAIPQWRNLVAHIDGRAPAPSREAAPQAAAAGQIKTWQERVGASSPNAKVENWAAAGGYIQDEIADLRAALAQQSAERAAGGELPPLPPTPGAVHWHPTLGELFDRFALHQYAVRYAVRYADLAIAGRAAHPGEAPAGGKGQA